MSLRERSFPTLRSSAIAYEDDDVVVIDKPPFVPSQASRQDAHDDLPARLAAFLLARDGQPAYVGTHQRLDRATSGLITYAKRREANAWLAKAFEGREVVKTYVAVVSGQRLPDRARWQDALAERGERVEVVASGGVMAKTSMQVIARRGERALVQLDIETGRTHQIRAQLAHRGASIVGDALYGGAPFRRLALHATAIAIPPSIAVRREPPPSFAQALANEPSDVLDPSQRASILEDAAEHRYALARSADTTCFRWLNESGDGAPRIAVDVYGEHVVLHAYGDDDVSSLADTLVESGARGVYLKRRPKTASRLDESAMRVLAPARPIAGEAADAEIEVVENGLPLLVRLGEGLSTGLFLDQRANRALVRAESSSARVLNLFSYTCAFSIAAAAGGAREVLSVDAAKKQLERGTRGFAHAALDVGLHETIADDAFDVLDRLARRGRTFDLVICDPPTFSSTKKSRFTSGKMWIDLAARLLRVVAPGGRILATSNDRRGTQDALRRAFRTAASAQSITLAQVKDLAPPVDYPVLPGDSPHLKAVWVTRG